MEAMNIISKTISPYVDKFLEPYLDPFYVIVLFQYPMKAENLWFSDAF